MSFSAKTKPNFGAERRAFIFIFISAFSSRTALLTSAPRGGWGGCALLISFWADLGLLVRLRGQGARSVSRIRVVGGSHRGRSAGRASRGTGEVLAAGPLAQAALGQFLGTAPSWSLFSCFRCRSRFRSLVPFPTVLPPKRVFVRFVRSTVVTK